MKSVDQLLEHPFCKVRSTPSMCYSYFLHAFIHLQLQNCPWTSQLQPLCPGAQPCALTLIFSTESLWVWVLDSFLMISAPVTGPEEALAGGGRLAVPSSSIVCSLTVAAPKQTLVLRQNLRTKIIYHIYLQAVMNFQVLAHTYAVLSDLYTNKNNLDRGVLGFVQ